MHMFCSLVNVQFEIEDPHIFKSEQLSISKDTLEGFTLEDPLKEEDFLLNDDLTQSIGKMDLGEYRRNEFLGTQYDISDVDLSQEDALIIKQSRKVSASLDMWLLALWLVKDHAVNTNILYTHIYRWENSSTLRIKKENLTYMANGLHESVKINTEELERVHDWLSFVENYVVSKSNHPKKSSEEYLIENNYALDYGNLDEIYRSDDRISRALIFVTAARNQAFLSAKIANYISAIEALVTSDKGSLVMQASERTAMIIGKDRAEKIRIHDALREAYSTRSSYVHGDALKKTLEAKLKNISVTTDDIVRRLIKEIISNHPEIAKLKGDKLTEWYKENFLFS
ncbi:hypothetical protein KQ939_14945 [Planococcus sp. CP5-4]|uniref:HEPN domain-containing protein n=1 Tax=unclassified Planococcus (in: firmicutes) TaxID=2662419 RepID=UPI001C21B6FB|nr:MULTISPECIES: HEPN domain-containing protein [unclassified Planococcus (in: firmicutes)]MBU9674664.1 hypothetical protein [Planococcus sp. CP5-4_YE]MBV0910185.1 hypothetical protein [Planococcus sp. CP5-4_UN]MBW6064975.1 hypothetical protein [Planococcus sp. CP5-4]